MKCPLDGSVYAKAAFNNTVCETCQLCKLGADALGLNVILEGFSINGASNEDPLGLL